MSITTLEAAVEAARPLLGEQGMDSLRSRLESIVLDEIDDAARRTPGAASDVWKATRFNYVAAQDILSEVAS